MPFVKNRSTFLIQPIIFMAIFFFHDALYSQNTVRPDTSIKISKGSIIQSKGVKTFVPKDTIINVPGLVPADSYANEKTVAFYDSLKSKASKKILTKAIFDLVIVSPDTVNKKRIEDNSRNNFVDYRGKKIRKITITRLNPFGTDLNNPGYYNPAGIERFLNRTHVNTYEKAIRKYVLFAEGDTISPLTLSDNERIIRQLPYIDDAKIIVVPVSGEEADIVIITKDLYTFGGEFNLRSFTSGKARIYEKNIFGIGHQFIVDIPYSSGRTHSPGIGLNYNVFNMWKSFIDLNLNYYNALGTDSLGFSLSKSLLTTTTKYAGGITIRRSFRTAKIDTSNVTRPLKYSYQDFWIQRSFMISRESATRLIAGVRYINNNVYLRPDSIDPNSHYPWQRYELYMGSVAYSVQKYYKTNLIYSYGRTEDIPYGTLIRLTSGWEINEFKRRTYAAIDVSCGQSLKSLGYFYTYAGFGTYFRNGLTEQGTLSAGTKYFSNLLKLGSYRFRSFVNINYIRGFDRYSDEYIYIPRGDVFTGFVDPSFRGTQRLVLNLESVFFSPANVYGFRFAFFGFGDMAFIAANREIINNGRFLSGVGLGIRVRNDNLIFNTLQIKIGYFPNPPMYSRISNINISGEQLLHPNNFDPGPPAVIPYR